jgi:hypothetical protein
MFTTAASVFCARNGNNNSVKWMTAKNCKELDYMVWIGIIME